jgi:hypothetical protein
MPKLVLVLTLQLTLALLLLLKARVAATMRLVIRQMESSSDIMENSAAS